MHLFTKITLLVFCVLATIVGFDVLQIQNIITNYDQSLEEQMRYDALGISSRISSEIISLKENAMILASASEVSQAIIQVDNEVLSSWGKGVLGNCDMVLFTDLGGRVLARQPDEYRFGDIIASLGYFSKRELSEILVGASEIDGQPSLFATVPVNQYNDIRVGTVVLVTHLTPTMLGRIVGNSSMQLQVQYGPKTISTPLLPGKKLHSFELPQLLDYTAEAMSFETTLYADKRYDRLIMLKHSAATRGAIAVFFLIGLCSFFLHRYLSPHARLISLISRYENKSSSLQEFRKHMLPLQQEGDRDIKNISGAMILMVETIDKNNRSIDAKNRRLKKTVSQLEQSLSEVKTLSGLLPICSYCKKIRDDQGYWSQLEEYISSRADATFSHGICPDCVHQHYPEYADEISETIATAHIDS